jgi:Sec-independent protein translocase protein TatA
MPSLTDVAVAAFVTVLVFGGLYLPRVADAIGRFVRRLRGARDDAGAPPPT